MKITNVNKKKRYLIKFQSNLHSVYLIKIFKEINKINLSNNSIRKIRNINK